MKKKIITIFIISILFIFPRISWADTVVAKLLSGFILLQVKSKGEAWYVNPFDLKRYYLGRPQDAFDIMRRFSIGIKKSDLEKIPVGLIDSAIKDDDQDGLANDLEIALGTDPKKKDTDGDSFDDGTEIKNGYNPMGEGKTNIDKKFSATNIGRIFLQVENAGEAWYVNPVDQKRYFLGRPADAFTIMRHFGLGITNENLEKIESGAPINTDLEPVAPNIPETNTTTIPNIPTPNYPTSTTPIILNGDQIIPNAARAMRENDINAVVSYFTPDMKKAMEYTMDFLDSESRLMLSNILSGASIKSQTNDEIIYSSPVYFSLGGYKIEMKFHVKKQADGTWLIANL